MSTRTPVVSIILTVYNAVKYLSICLDSLIHQSYHNIEIICVNDCSTDNSLLILLEYASNDERILVVNSDVNGGHGASRNVGIRNARGKYLRMVDPDDIIPLDSTEKMVLTAEKYNSHFVLGGYKYCSPNGKIGNKSPAFPEKLIVNASIESERTLWGGHIHVAFLIQTDVIKNNCITYPEAKQNKTIMLVDIHFLARLIPVMNHVSIIPETIYYYRKHPDSTIKGPKTASFFSHYIQAIKKTVETFNNNQLPDAAQYHLRYRLSHHIPRTLLPSIVTSLDKQDSKKVLGQFGYFFSDANAQKLCDQQYQSTPEIPPHMKSLVTLLSNQQLDIAYDFIVYISNSIQLEKQASRAARKIERHLISTELKLQKIKASTSWKVTAPQRWLDRKIKKYSSFR